MIPALVAGEVRDALLDYLRTTWSLSDAAAERVLFEFLRGEGDSEGIFKGPYVQVRLPFAPADPEARMPIDVRPAYRPYHHQLQAWQRLSSRDGHEPEPTLIVTGTGSGKTEAFLYPILDHCWRAREAGEGGIKAILLYPMNALASDQARRIGEVVNGDERLAGKLRVGMYVGGDGQHATMGPGHVIDMRKQLLLDPPDVLLTNYKMLDFLLLRPKDRALWAKNGPDTLRYVVIDELHTYDGAQGTDVACLLRRLSARLGMRRPFCPVGTSATVTSGGADSEARLLRFAGDVFAREPDELAIVGERRRTPASFFGLFGGVRWDGWPEDAEALLARPDDTLESHVARVARAWFPDVRRLSEGEGVDRAALADAVMGHPAMRALIEVASEGIVDLEALDANLGAKIPSYAGRDEEDRRRLLVSMLTLLSWSEHEAGGRRTPLVNVQVQLWIREIRRLLRELSSEPRFHWDDERPRRRGEPAALPMYLCRACGHSGWVSLRNDVDDRLETDRRRIGEQAVRRSPDMLYLHTDGHAAAEELPGVEDRVCPRCARLGREAKCRFCKGETVGVYTHQARSSQTPPKDVQRCPACGTDFALGIMGSRAATLASVAVGHLYTSPFNRDQRLLAFSDSVQDASHRAGFFSGRTQRFSLRKGMLAVVPHEGAMPLPEVAPAMIAYYAPRPPPGSMVAGFMPHDLEYREAYERYMGALEEHARAADRARRDGAPEPEPPAPDATVLRDLGERLRWEVTRELGLGTRIGRTLERTGCASVAVDPDRFGEALAAVRRRVPERVGAVQGVPEARWAQFLGGLVARLRMRGGIHDPLLAPYFERGGSDYQLSKAMSPLLSPFGLFTSRPLFLTDDPEPKRFDTVRPGKRGNWYTDWARRALGVGLSAGDAADVYGAVLPLLEKARLMVGAHDRKKSAWGLDPHALAVSRDVRVLRCPECGHEHWGVARDPAALEGGPCLRYRCTGELAAVVMDGGDARVRTYYQKLYDQPELGRVRASEHTGLLERSDREGLEERFKERRRPDAPNMLSCTPTLEMGIDIGDLSATMLLSVPPTTASYLQRIGRAGRKTGNALILTFSTVRPHDLHFFGDPEAAMAGPVEPPGCYLDAPEILKRQALAWCMDAWAREGGTHEDALPGAVQGMLSGDANRGFPASFFRFLEERRDGLREGFLASFGTSAATRRALEDFMRGAGPTASVLEQRVLRFAEEVRAEHKQLRSLAKSVRERMKKMDAEPQKVAGYEDERADLKNELSFLEKEAGAVFKKSLLGLMCERGLLPNYAFPESGVTLKAFVARDGDHHGGAERYEWVRSASTALRELAPFNTFYAQARRVRVDNLDVGARRGRKGQGQIEPWQLCSSCGHMRPVARLGPSPSCPSCGAGDFREQGRRRDLVKIDTVFAHSRQRDAVFSDESEERERQSYVAERWFDVDTRHVREALLDLGTPFGFELLGRVTIREINFGREAMAQAQTVGGREVPDVAFEVCEQCGWVRPEAHRRRKGERMHRPWCPDRHKPEEKQAFRRVHLYRELETEGLRIVLPVAMLDPEVQLPNMRAALELGMRRHYGGDPEHLRVEIDDEPTFMHEGARRRYLIVHDTVPGGTGMLAELTRDRGAKLRRVFEAAAEALEGCACRDREERGACYQCLYAHRHQYDQAVLDRARALEMVRKVLGAFDRLGSVSTIASVEMASILESELEHRFIGRLADWAEGREDVEWEETGPDRWRITVGGRGWRIEPQVTLDEGHDVAIPSRVDFVLWPEEGGQGVRPVAVFADGFTYHGKPGERRGRIGDDLAKRQAIARSGRFWTWSLTWFDLDAFSGNLGRDVPPWFDDEAARRAEQVAGQVGGDSLQGVVRSALMRDPVTALVAYLREPAESRWRAAATLSAMGALVGKGRKGPSEDVERLDARLREAEEAPAWVVPAGGDRRWAAVAIGGSRSASWLVHAGEQELSRLLDVPRSVRGVLRLDDGAPMRSTSGFPDLWRQVLRAHNLLQFLPAVEVVTTEQLLPVLGAVPESGPPRPYEQVTSEPPAPSMVADREGAFTREALEALDNVDASLQEPLRRMMRLGVAVPSVPYEHGGGAQGVQAQIELGWPDRKVGVCLEDEAQDAERLREEGWTVWFAEDIDERALVARLTGSE